VFVSSIEARQPRAAVDRRHKTVSTERAQHTEIPLPRDREPFRFGWTRAKFVRGSVRFAARGNMVLTLRGKATNIASRGSRAQSILGLMVAAVCLIPARSGSKKNKYKLHIACVSMCFFWSALM
jgi:hypothetical protein